MCDEAVDAVHSLVATGRDRAAVAEILRSATISLDRAPPKQKCEDAVVVRLEKP